MHAHHVHANAHAPNFVSSAPSDSSAAAPSPASSAPQIPRAEIKRVSDTTMPWIMCQIVTCSSWHSSGVATSYLRPGDDSDGDSDEDADADSYSDAASPRLLDCSARGDSKRHTQMHFLIAFGLLGRNSNPQSESPTQTQYVSVASSGFSYPTLAVILMNSRVRAEARTHLQTPKCAVALAFYSLSG